MRNGIKHWTFVLRLRPTSTPVSSYNPQTQLKPTAASNVHNVPSIQKPIQTSFAAFSLSAAEIKEIVDKSMGHVVFPFSKEK